MRRAIAAGLFTALLITWAMVSPASSFAATEKSTAVIKVEHVGGFVGPNFKSARLPDVVLYSDGRILTPRNLSDSVRQMFQGSVSKIILQSEITAFIKAMKTPIGGWGLPGVADVPSTRVSLMQNGKERIVEVYALGFALNSSLKDASAARKKLSLAIEHLIALGGKKTIYSPTKYEVWPQGNISNGTATGILWPNDIAPPTTNCVGVTAQPFQALLRNAGSKPWLLPNGDIINLTWRPVLPGEIACKR
ncbi:MAG: hypothetical protein WCP71_01120 [Actinomycetes bacterium]